MLIAHLRKKYAAETLREKAKRQGNKDTYEPVFRRHDNRVNT